jgi:hypothetical protein
MAGSGPSSPLSSPWLASTTVTARDHDIIFLVANCNCIMRLLETGNGYCYSHSDNTKSVKFLEFAGVPVVQPDQQEASTEIGVLCLYVKHLLKA